MKREDIRTKPQGATPFFPNMLNNYSVEVCLKEDVDKYCDQQDTEILRLKEKISILREELARR